MSSGPCRLRGVALSKLAKQPVFELWDLVDRVSP